MEGRLAPLVRQAPLDQPERLGLKVQLALLEQLVPRVQLALQALLEQTAPESPWS